MKNEKTSKKVAAIAGRILQRFADLKRDYSIAGTATVMVRDDKGFWWAIGPVADLKALAASCLTQSPNKKADPLDDAWNRLTRMTVAERLAFVKEFNEYNPDKPRRTK